MGGAHGGIKGKGPFPYEQNAHVPLLIAHPAAKAGATTTALTSHLDLLPTFVGRRRRGGRRRCRRCRVTTSRACSPIPSAQT
jgi:hypothetical protein